MHRSKIEWVDFPWNPLTGCMNDCKYCQSKKKSKRFAGDIRMNLKQGKYHKDGEVFVLDEKFISVSGTTLSHPFGFAPTYHKYRMDNLKQLKGTKNVLVCGDGDLFGPWVPEEYIIDIISNCEMYEKNHYLFLTRYPERYKELAYKGLLPDGDKYWYGWTYTNDNMKNWDSPNGYHTFVCIEPVLGEVAIIPNFVEWVVVGAETGGRPGKVVPEFDWIKKVVVECDSRAIPVYMSDSLEGTVNKQSLRKDFPKILMQKELSEAMKAKIYDVCCKCGKEKKKSSMITLSARSTRGEQPKQFCFMCKKCFKKMCEDYSVEIPDLKGLR